MTANQKKEGRLIAASIIHAAILQRGQLPSPDEADAPTIYAALAVSHADALIEALALEDGD